MNFWTELLTRWALDTTTFHKKLRGLGVKILSIGSALILVPATFNTTIDALGIKLDQEFDLSLLIKIASYFILAGIIISAVASTAVKDPEEIKK